MLGTNAVLEEMLVHADQYGFKVSNVFKMSGQTIEIPKLELSDEDWEIVEMFISTKKASLNLVFVVMLHHFPEKFNYENLQIFSSGSLEVGDMARDMLIKLNTDAGKAEQETFRRELISRLTGMPVLA